MSDLQRDMHLVDLAFGIAFDDNDPSAEAWQRLKPRLTPNRERVARAIFDSDNDINPKTGEAYTWEQSPYHQPDYYRMADAAIKAMEGKE